MDEARFTGLMFMMIMAYFVDQGKAKARGYERKDQSYFVKYFYQQSVQGF